MQSIQSSQSSTIMNAQKFLNTQMECKLSAGTSIPFSIKAEGDVFQIMPNSNNQIEIIQDIFIKGTEDNLLLSLDGENWQEFTQLFTGNFGVNISIKDSNPKIEGILNAFLRQ